MMSNGKKLVLVVDDTPTNITVPDIFEQTARCPPRIPSSRPGVCTENLDPDVVVMKSAKDRV